MNLRLAVLLVLCFVSAIRAETPQEEIVRQVPQALKILDGYHADRPQSDERTLHLVYWTPSDRAPAPQHRERLSRLMLDIQAFYKTQMKQLGLGERTIRLAKDADGLLKIHLVKGAKPYSNYDVKSGQDIRKECKPLLAAAGIEADKETIVIFCNMSNWDAEKRTMSQNSPYYAGGGLRAGTAWQVDSPLLDPALLAKKDETLKDGQYGKISVGKYNSIFVGGVCHELGHALGLPHNSERPEQREAFGTALMGGGNRTYGDDRRGEGRGSFLTLAEGLRLASHPMFSGSVKGIDLPASVKLQDVAVQPAKDGKSFTFSAKAATKEGDPPVYAIIGYLDPDGGQDYDAPTVTAIPDREGRFTLNCNALKAGKPGVLRVVACQANGGRIGDKAYSLNYDVAKNGAVDLKPVK
jgi:hypothetical protein